MKVFFFLLICCLQQMYSNASLSWFTGLNLGPECITLTQLYRATETLCMQKNNTDLWQKVIDCHRPMTDEFMRASGEAQCPRPKYVENANDTTSTIQDVFFNICGLVEGGWIDLAKTGYCLVFGQSDPFIMTHSDEVARVKSQWDEKLPCKVGQCVLALGLGV